MRAQWLERFGWNQNQDLVQDSMPRHDDDMTVLLRHDDMTVLRRHDHDMTV